MFPIGETHTCIYIHVHCVHLVKLYVSASECTCNQNVHVLPYSGNLSREKTFANFAVFEHPRNFWGGYRSGFI